MSRHKAQRGHRQQLLAVSMASAFLLSACGGGSDGGTSPAAASLQQLAPGAGSSGTTDPGLAARSLNAGPPPASCNYSPWVRGTIYEAGSIVNYSGSLYIAKMWNAGSVPTPNQYGWSDWAPYQCGTPAPAPVPAPAPAPAPVPGPATCPAAASWVQGQVYEGGSIVSYAGRLYVAKMWNAGSLPTPNANGWSDWSPYDCGTPTPAPAPAPAPAPGPASCSPAPWVQGKVYEAGSIVSYSGSLYIAKMWNAGSLPTPNASGWSDWSPYDCSTGAPAPAPAPVVAPGGFRINGDNAYQDRTDVVSLKNGSHVVVWMVDPSVLPFTGRAVCSLLFQPNGSVITPPTCITTPVTAYTRGPAVAALADGGYVVAWSAAATDASIASANNLAQRYDASGAAVGGVQQVNDIAGDGAYDVTVAPLGAGYVFAWSRGTGFGGTSASVIIKRYGADGQPLAAEQTVSTGHADRIGALSGGGFVIVRSEGPTDRYGYCGPVLERSACGALLATRYDSQGTQVGETLVENYNDQQSSLTRLAGGGFAVGSFSIVQRFSSDGAPVGAPIPVDPGAAGPNCSLPLSANPCPPTQQRIAIAGLEDGGFVATWQALPATSPNTTIFVRRFAADGSAAGPVVQISNSALASAERPSIAALPGGVLVITWDSAGNIYERRMTAASLLAGATPD